MGTRAGRAAVLAAALMMAPAGAQAEGADNTGSWVLGSVGVLIGALGGVVVGQVGGLEDELDDLRAGGASDDAIEEKETQIIEAQSFGWMGVAVGVGMVALAIVIWEDDDATVGASATPGGAMGGLTLRF